MADTCAGQLLFILTICEAGRCTFSWITQSSCRAWLPANVAYCFATFEPLHRPPSSRPRGWATCRWPPMTTMTWRRRRLLRRSNSPGETLPPPLPHCHILIHFGGSVVQWLLSLLRFVPFSLWATCASTSSQKHWEKYVKYLQGSFFFILEK